MGIPSQEQVTLLTDYDVDSKYNLAYQTVYANVRFAWDKVQTNQLGQQRQQSILLATPTAYAGQAAVAANVAIAAAQNGTPAIVVDADLRTPALQQRFGVHKDNGLSNLLVQEPITLQGVRAALCETFIPQLHLLCGGTAPIHTLGMHNLTKLRNIIACLRQFLEETEQEPGMIIVNSPAVLAGTDAALISDSVDQTFLTVIVGRTTRRQAKQAQEQLQRAHAKLSGVILLDT